MALLSQYVAAEILSRLSFNKCHEAISEAVPVLLEALCNVVDQVVVAGIYGRLVSQFN